MCTKPMRSPSSCEGDVQDHLLQWAGLQPSVLGLVGLTGLRVSMVYVGLRISSALRQKEA